jgi:hypothetical protein
MRRLLTTALLGATLLASQAQVSLAGANPHLVGHVYCADTGLPLNGATVIATDGADFAAAGTTDATGYYSIMLPPAPSTIEATVDPMGGTVITPPGGFYVFTTSESELEVVRDFVIDSPKCQEEIIGACWLTAGGAKFSSITGGNVGENGPRHSWGGNVYPGCSPTAGEGGQWNHVNHADKLHFQSFSAQVIRCGNVDGIPPGSTSPATPFNFIEWEGAGRVKGIKGNDASFDPAYCFVRNEDRNEPGSNGQRDGNFKDRYFIHVYTDPSDPLGSTVFVLDTDSDASTVDPVTITDGNMQIHISSCDFDELAQSNPAIESRDEGALPSLAVSLAPAYPNPTKFGASMRLYVPHESFVSLSVVDLSGRNIRDIVASRLPAGERTVTWNLLDNYGNRVPRGMYFVRMNVNGRVYGQNLSVLD